MTMVYGNVDGQGSDLELQKPTMSPDAAAPTHHKQSKLITIVKKNKHNTHYL
jgi:hypothetical protein